MVEGSGLGQGQGLGWLREAVQVQARAFCCPSLTVPPPGPKDAGEPACFIVKMRKSGELHLTLLSVSQLFPKCGLYAVFIILF